MNRLHRTLAKVCDNCPLCNYARRNPETRFGKVMSWHGQYCPAWKAQQEIAAEREEKTMRDDDAAIQTKENAVE
ncbi:MAG: hypothetical protein V3W07_12095 [Syntrophobacteria bacterium]|nr:hypothetical protein [Deltaproteobacteria bacterium]